MTAAELIDHFLSALVRRGGNRRQWRLALGAIRTYDPATHPHCNWAFAPTGTPAQVEAIEQLSDELRLRYPIVKPAARG